MPGIKRLGDVVIPGRDYPAKVKIEEVLDHEVMLTAFDHVVIMKEVTLADGSKTEAEDANYYNVTVDDNDVIKTFSTGSSAIVKVLTALEAMQKQGQNPLPLLCTFRREGRVYLVE